MWGNSNFSYPDKQTQPWMNFQVTESQKKIIHIENDIWHRRAWNEHLKDILGKAWAEDARLEGDGNTGNGKSLCDLLGYSIDDFSYVSGDLNTDYPDKASDSRGGWYVLQQTPPAIWGDDSLRDQLAQKIGKALFNSQQGDAKASDMATALMATFSERQSKAALWMFIKVLKLGHI